MDPRRFDAFAGILGGDRSSRRAATSGLAALLLAIAAGAPPAEARHHKKKKKKCKACEVRKGRRCRKIPDDTACKEDGRCLNGKCNPKPSCAAADSPCFENGQCCSQVCNVGLIRCAVGGAGASCFSFLDCISETCVGYVCQP